MTNPTTATGPAEPLDPAMRGSVTHRLPAAAATEEEGATPTTCTTRVDSGYRSRVCGRPVKDEGMCGTHLGAKRRRETARAEREHAADVNVRRWQRAKLVCDALEERGVTARPHLDVTGRYSGGVVVDALHTDALLALLPTPTEVTQ